MWSSGWQPENDVVGRRLHVMAVSDAQFARSCHSNPAFIWNSLRNVSGYRFLESGYGFLFFHFSASLFFQALFCVGVCNELLKLQPVERVHSSLQWLFSRWQFCCWTRTGPSGVCGQNQCYPRQSQRPTVRLTVANGKLFDSKEHTPLWMNKPSGHSRRGTIPIVFLCEWSFLRRKRHLQ